VDGGAELVCRRPGRAGRRASKRGRSVAPAPWTSAADALGGHDPDYRFSLANERTFLAWIRTALALLAGGVAAVQLVPAFKFPGGRLTLGVILVLLSLAVATGSYFRWMANERAMRLDLSLQHSLIPRLLAAGLTVVALLALLMVIVSG